MILLQATTSGFDWGSIIGTGGPLVAFCTILGYVSRLWIENRKDKREGKVADRQSESGIVETTAAAIKLVREQMEAMGSDIERLTEKLSKSQTDVAVLMARVSDRDRTIEKLNDRVAVLEAENERLRRGR